MTTIEIEVGRPPNPERWETVEFLVDSGAMYSVVPGDLLRSLGIAPLVEQEFRLANRDRIRRRKGGAVFRLGERIGTVDVIFGEPGDSNLLGVVTLESLGLGLNPLKRELIDLPMLL